MVAEKRTNSNIADTVTGSNGAHSRGMQMQFYRFYMVHPDGSIRGRVDGAYASDEEALQHARTINDGYAIDVWKGPLRIGIVDEQGGAARKFP
jgi:hypothetical protein